MKKMLFVVIMSLMVMSVGFCQRSVTSSTDYFNVPTATILPAGTASVAVQAAGNQIWGQDNNVGVIVDVGVSNRIGISATTDIKDFDRDNIVAGVKFIAGESDEVSDNGQLALFLYNVGRSRTAIPGLSLTVQSADVKWLSWTVSGWYVDNNWQGGLGATATLTTNFNLQAEYSSTGKLVGGVGLSYKNLFAEARFLDQSNELYGAAGVKFPVW